MEYAHLSILTRENFYQDATDHVEHSDHNEHELSSVKYCQKLFSPAPSEHFHQVLNKSLTVPKAKRHIISNLRY